MSHHLCSPEACKMLAPALWESVTNTATLWPRPEELVGPAQAILASWSCASLFQCLLSPPARTPTPSLCFATVDGVVSSMGGGCVCGGGGVAHCYKSEFFAFYFFRSMENKRKRTNNTF